MMMIMKKKENMTNKKKLASFIKKNRLSHKEVAILIEKKTKRKYSVRAIRSWLADESLSSSRPCKSWVIEALTGK